MHQILDGACPFDEQTFLPSRMLYRKTEGKPRGIDTNGNGNDGVTYTGLEFTPSATKIYYPLAPQSVDPDPYDHTAAVHRIERLGHRLLYILTRRRYLLRGTLSVCIPELVSKSHSSCLAYCKFLEGCPDETITRCFIHDTRTYLTRGKGLVISWVCSLRTTVIIIIFDYVLHRLYARIRKL